MSAANAAQEKSAQGFSPVPFPTRALMGTEQSRYRVFSAAGECITVEAATAAEALRKSGVTSASRISRLIPGREVLVDQDGLGQ